MAKKKVESAPLSERRAWIEADNCCLSVSRQLALIDLPRSTYYYQPVVVSDDDLILMRLIDRQYTDTPFYGVRRMWAMLRQAEHRISIKRVRRYYHLLGLEAIGPRPRLSIPERESAHYPYLLRNRKITQANEVWSTDITYIPMERGFLYLVAVLDWHSRYVLSWELSNTLEPDFCLRALDAALAQYGTPTIFNSDQGSQFTSRVYTERLLEAGIAISRDGVGRATDNAFVERLWRSVKYESIYGKEVADGHELYNLLAAYFDFYNHHRIHQGLGYRFPADVYFEKVGG